MNRLYWCVWVAFGVCGVRAGIAICHAVAQRGDLGGAMVGYRSCALWACVWIVASLIMYANDCRRSSRLPG
jgi:hypothetical protein